MKSIHVRLSDEEEAKLQGEAELSGKSVSEVVRETLFRDPERGAALRPASSGQVEELGERLVLLAETLDRVRVACGKIESLEGVLGELLALKGGQAELAGRVESAEHEIRSLSENLTRLVDLQVEERRAPFGMNRAFFQVATMASFTLARGTFSHSPEAWEPYKEEARRRAFKSEGETS